MLRHRGHGWQIRWQADLGEKQRLKTKGTDRQPDDKDKIFCMQSCIDPEPILPGLVYKPGLILFSQGREKGKEREREGGGGGGRVGMHGECFDS